MKYSPAIDKFPDLSLDGTGGVCGWYAGGEAEWGGGVRALGGWGARGLGDWPGDELWSDPYNPAYFFPRERRKCSSMAGSVETWTTTKKKNKIDVNNIKIFFLSYAL